MKIIMFKRSYCGVLIYDQIHSRNLDTTWICKSIYLFLQTYVNIYLNITPNSSLPLSTVTDFIWFWTVNMDSTTRKYGIILSPNYDEKFGKKSEKAFSSACYLLIWRPLSSALHTTNLCTLYFIDNSLSLFNYIRKPFNRDQVTTFAIPQPWTTNPIVWPRSLTLEYIHVATNESLDL